MEEIVDSIRWEFTTKLVVEKNIMHSDFEKAFFNKFIFKMFNNSATYVCGSTDYFWRAIKIGVNVPLDYISEVVNDKSVSYVSDWEKWGEPIYEYMRRKSQNSLDNYFEDFSWLIEGASYTHKKNIERFLDGFTEDFDLVLRIRLNHL